jgi:hypothetical protein
MCGPHFDQVEVQRFVIPLQPEWRESLNAIHAAADAAAEYAKQQVLQTLLAKYRPPA